MGSCPRRYSIALRIISLSTEVLVELCQICCSNLVSEKVGEISAITSFQSESAFKSAKTIPELVVTLTVTPTQSLHESIHQGLSGYVPIFAVLAEFGIIIQEYTCKDTFNRSASVAIVPHSINQFSHFCRTQQLMSTSI
ncbi:conserved hypothetical protein [Trichinella spiralis]|uniref:hypothetical protein n=1 Tax=Trichinella spiralis TaxID=6334 RepID=UPI0001EFC1A1|nr:conserved hypothetical protein [Trichinella spiralis]